VIGTVAGLILTALNGSLDWQFARSRRRSCPWSPIRWWVPSSPPVSQPTRLAGCCWPRLLTDCHHRPWLPR